MCMPISLYIDAEQASTILRTKKGEGSVLSNYVELHIYSYRYKPLCEGLIYLDYSCSVRYMSGDCTIDIYTRGGTACWFNNQPHSEPALALLAAWCE